MADAFEGRTCRPIFRSIESPCHSCSGRGEWGVYLASGFGETHVALDSLLSISLERLIPNSLVAASFSADRAFALASGLGVTRAGTGKRTDPELTRERLHTRACHLSGKPDQLDAENP
jgi:hypothetical protein